MRRVHRPELPSHVRRELHRLQKMCNDTQSAQDEWKLFRQRAAAAELVGALQTMRGTRRRCFYCSYGRGADVEHFAPVSPYWMRTFVWVNHLLICTECNRAKGNRFPGSLAAPLLINPADSQPWEYFFLDLATGHIAPRFERDGTPNERAAETLKHIGPLLDEAVAEGRLETIERLRHAASECLENPSSWEAQQRLAREVRRDQFGISTWVTRFEVLMRRLWLSKRTCRRYGGRSVAWTF